MLQRQFKVTDPNRVWVSDITCFKVNGKYLYVCVVLDLFSRKVVATEYRRRIAPIWLPLPFVRYISTETSPAADVSQRPRPAIYIQHIPETASHEQGCPVFLEVRPSSRQYCSRVLLCLHEVGGGLSDTILLRAPVHEKC